MTLFVKLGTFAITDTEYRQGPIVELHGETLFITPKLSFRYRWHVKRKIEGRMKH